MLPKADSKGTEDENKPTEQANKTNGIITLITQFKKSVHTFLIE